MTQDKDPWPPLVVAAHRPAWIRVRDFVLTTAMWLLLAAMLNREFELFLDVYLERLGFGAALDRLGLLTFGSKRDWFDVAGHLTPYMFIVFMLVVSLATFAAYTLLRRYRALREAKPRPLSLAQQAREAALPPMVARVDVASGERGMGLDEVAVIDERRLLTMLHNVDRDTLATARALRIAMVGVTADGRYRVERASEPALEGGAAS